MTTPMFEQFRALKAEHPDAVLFYRMGDFYETFFEDAVLTARVLELTLTSRDKNAADPVPMAGVPHHAAAAYIHRMVEAGYKIAIAEQMEDPAHTKGLVRRQVVRVVTPGVTLDPGSLQSRAPNWLAGVFRSRRGWGLAVIDVSTGDLRACEADGLDVVLSELQRLEPKEVLLSPRAADEVALDAVVERLGAVRSEVAAEAWDREEALGELRTTLGVADVAGFGLTADGAATGAAGAVLRYARERLRMAPGNVIGVRTWHPGGFLVVDDTTRRNLELLRTLRTGDRKGSLLHLLDETGTAMGSRLLREWMSFPLREHAPIAARQAAVSALRAEPEKRAALQRALREVCDLERVTARITQHSAHARDLVGLKRALRVVPAALAGVADVEALAPHFPTELLPDVADEIERWLVDDPPLALTEGGLLRQGADPALDEVLELALHGRAVLSRLEARERDATGVSSLKIRPHGTWGHVFEVPRAQAEKIPKRFVPKQELAGVCRFITPELLELHDRVEGADARRRTLEYQHFVALRDRIATHAARLLALARKLAALDALSALAEVAERWRWSAPTLVEGRTLELIGSRHPVVEAHLPPGQFVPNDVRLDSTGRRLIVLTGPNMAGKSTVLRQTALAVLLAHMGSHVPAERATIGLCDRIFTRVGASDDLAQGASTFMVEMSETASILRHATDRSLVVLDEIGRGTSTYDGLSIAWAVAEDLADRIGCRAIFATHYHELCELAEVSAGVVNQSVAVSEQGEKILFLRRLKEGGASRSYGIQCGRLAGLPPRVVDRARTLLRHFEKHAPRNERQQLSLFGGAAPAPEEPAGPPPDPLRVMLAGIDPDAVSPREAHQLLDRLVGLLREEGAG